MGMYEPINDIRVGGTKDFYLDKKECPVCQAIDPESKQPIRLEIDKYAATHEEKEVVDYINDRLRLDLKLKVVREHFKKHSKYIQNAKDMIKKAAEKAALSRIGKLAEAFIDADEVIQDIINEGGRKIRTGELPVDKQLLGVALREQGQRKKMGSLQQMFQELDRARFKVIEGETVEEEKPDLLEDIKKRELKDANQTT